jgi:hypothetical protein
VSGTPPVGATAPAANAPGDTRPVPVRARRCPRAACGERPAPAGRDAPVSFGAAAVGAVVTEGVAAVGEDAGALVAGVVAVGELAPAEVDTDVEEPVPGVVLPVVAGRTVRDLARRSSALVTRASALSAALVARSCALSVALVARSSALVARFCALSAVLVALTCALAAGSLVVVGLALACWLPALSPSWLPAPDCPRLSEACCSRLSRRA